MLYTEAELRALREGIAKAQKTAAEARAAAEDLVKAQREAGANPLTDKTAFEAVDAKFRESSAAAQEAAELQARLNQAVGATHALDELREQRKEDDREGRSATDRLVNHPAYRSLKESGVLNSRAAHVNLQPVEVMTRSQLQGGILRQRTLVERPLDIIEPDKSYYPPLLLPQRQVRLLDVIEVGSTDSDSVGWVRETTHTNAAAPTAYNVAAPEAAYAWEPQSTLVRRIPHSIPATKGALADRAQLATVLQGNLAAGIRRTTESQVLLGNGSGENFTGIMTAVTATQAKGTDTNLDALHKALTVVRLALLDQGEPNFIGMNPSDYEILRLAKDSTGGHYHLGPPTEGGVSVAWGLPIVTSTLFTAGTALVGDGSHATLWVREGITVAASDSHADFFTKGLVMFVAEYRAAFAVQRINAFCKVTGITA
jgi:HK97 family phage major capsid protein